jgi:hypothetical protein
MKYEDIAHPPHVHVPPPPPTPRHMMLSLSPVMPSSPFLLPILLSSLHVYPIPHHPATNMTKLLKWPHLHPGLLVEWLCAWLTILGSVSGFDLSQGTYKNLWISCEYKKVLSDETKNRGPLYLSIYARQCLQWDVCDRAHAPLCRQISI